jgi:2-polyprenyl-3-methyl-5-hydroxy-6-metoxy-1,4-benzoquinol methylase
VPKLIERTLGGLHASLASHLSADLDRGRPILDIGCGTGAWLERLASLGFTNLWGVDRDIHQFECKRAKCVRCNLDTDYLDLRGIKFELITAIEVIEHLENPGRLLSAVATYLDDDGYFLMTTPNIHSLLCRFRFFVTGQLKQFDLKGDQTHVYPLLLTALRKMLPRYQLEIASQWWYPENGVSITSRSSLKLGVAVLRTLLPDDIPGDVLCLLLRRRIERLDD